MEYCRLGVVEFKWGFQRLSANTVLMMDNNIDETGAFACFAVKSVSTSKSAISASIVLPPLFSPPWFSDGKSPHGSLPVVR